MIRKVKAVGPEAAILLLGCAMRLAAIGSRSITYDDAFSIFLAQRPLVEIIRGTAADTMPPLYYFILHAWLYLGQDVIWLRLLSVFFGLLSGLVFYFFVRDLAGRTAAVWSSLFYAISPIHLYHAQDLRMYGLLSLLVCLHWWSAYRIMQKDGRASNHEWGVFLFSAALAFYTHNLAGFSIIAPSVFLILQRRWKLAARLIAVQAAALLLYLPWLIFLPGQIHKIQSAFWTPRPGILEIVQTVIMFSANLPLPGSNLIWGLAFSLLVFSTVLWWLLKKRKQIKLIAYPLVLLLTAPTLLFVISQFMRPVYVQRAFLPASFGYLILIGSCLAESFGQKSSRIPRAAAIGLLLAGLLSARLGFITFITYDQFPRSPFQSLANVLRSRSSELDCILHDNKLSYFPTHFYAPELAQSFLADSPGSINDTFAPASQAAMQIFPVPDVQAASADCNHIAFIVFDKSLIELGGETYHPVWQYLSQHFRGGNKMAVGDIWIYFFERNRP